MTSAKERLNEDGFVWFRNALSGGEFSKLAEHCEFVGRPGHRPKASDNLLALLSAGSRVGDLCHSFLPDSKPVRLVAFDKTDDSNWAVPWHQDRVIAVAEKQSVSGFENWTKRGDYWHVEPPVALLRNMIFARVHFDASDAENGALEIAKGTHKLGKVAAAEARREAELRPMEVCSAQPGDVLFVNALTLHRSNTATVPSRRRALRVDYAAFDLPAPLRWAF